MLVSAPPFAIAVWHLDPDGTMADPGAGMWRVNFDDGVRILVSEVDDNGNDVSAIFAEGVDGDRLVVQVVAAATRFAVVDIAAPVDHTGWWELEVTQIFELTTPAVEDWVFIFRHQYEVSDIGPTVDPPASLVPAGEHETLVQNVLTALVAEVRADPVRDAYKLDRAVRDAIEDMRRFLDGDGGEVGVPVYPSAADVNPAVFSGLVTLSAIGMPRPGFAYGTAGYDAPDPNGALARGAVFANLSTHKIRFGVG